MSSGDVVPLMMVGQGGAGCGSLAGGREAPASAATDGCNGCNCE
jgi:hypothetical protein